MTDIAPAAVCVEDFETIARERLDRHAYDYCAGGAGTEATLQWNVKAFEDWAILPRSFAATVPDLAVTLAAGASAIPIGVSAVSLQRMVHPDGECGLARAVERLHAPMMLSMFGSEAPENVAAAAPTATKLQQLYLLTEKAVTRSVMHRAAAAGFSGFVVTADTPVQGVRRRDRRRALNRFDAVLPALCNDPTFLDLLRARGGDAAELVDDLFPNRAATWDDFAELISATSLPVYVKGILHPDDADVALDVGATGIVVSNHGGRQLDRAPSAISMLVEVVDRCGDRAEILFDSGVRTGPDVFVALALGAAAVFVGRPAVWGLAVDGADGAESVIRLLVDDLERTMSMAGAATISGIHRSMLRRRR